MKTAAYHPATANGDEQLIACRPTTADQPGHLIVELMRHAQTRLQAEHRYVGSTDDDLLPEAAAQLHPATRQPARVYITPLARTAQTARIVYPSAKLAVVPDLEEMDFGAFERRNYQELEHDVRYRTWVEGGCNAPCPGGEGREAFSRRVCKAFARLMDGAVTQGEEELILVAHGGTIMAVMERYGQPARQFFDWKVEHGCSLILDASDWRLSRTLLLIGTTDHRKACR